MDNFQEKQNPLLKEGGLNFPQTKLSFVAIIIRLFAALRLFLAVVITITGGHVLEVEISHDFSPSRSPKEKLRGEED